MEIELDCACGGRLTVHEGQAGLSRPCPRCGREVTIPSLQELRKLGGIAVPVNPVWHVESLVQSGDLPPPRCIACDDAPQWKIPLVAECERAQLQSDGIDPIWILLVPAVSLWALFRPRRGELREYGHDVVVPTPVLLCGQCRDRMQEEPSEVPAKLARILFIVGALAALIYWPLGLALLGVAYVLAVLSALRQSTFRRQLCRWFSAVPGYAVLREEHPGLKLHLGADPQRLATPAPAPR